MPEEHERTVASRAVRVLCASPDRPHAQRRQRCDMPRLISWPVLCAAFLLATTASSTPFYEIITNGTCADHGMAPITNPNMCSQAASALLHNDIEAQLTTMVPRPEGCYNIVTPVRVAMPNPVLHGCECTGDNRLLGAAGLAKHGMDYG